MTIEVLAEEQSFKSLTRDWSELMEKSAANYLFLTPAFQKIWWRNFGEGGLRIVALRNDQQKLAALAPLMLKEQTLSLIGGEDPDRSKYALDKVVL